MYLYLYKCVHTCPCLRSSCGVQVCVLCFARAGVPVPDELAAANKAAAAQVIYGCCYTWLLLYMAAATYDCCYI